MIRMEGIQLSGFETEQPVTLWLLTHFSISRGLCFPGTEMCSLRVLTVPAPPRLGSLGFSIWEPIRRVYFLGAGQMQSTEWKETPSFTMVRSNNSRIGVSLMP